MPLSFNRRIVIHQSINPDSGTSIGFKFNPVIQEYPNRALNPGVEAAVGRILERPGASGQSLADTDEVDAKSSLISATNNINII